MKFRSIYFLLEMRYRKSVRKRPYFYSCFIIDQLYYNIIYIQSMERRYNNIIGEISEIYQNRYFSIEMCMAQHKLYV